MSVDSSTTPDRSVRSVSDVPEPPAENPGSRSVPPPSDTALLILGELSRLAAARALVDGRAEGREAPLAIQRAYAEAYNRVLTRLELLEAVASAAEELADAWENITDIVAPMTELQERLRLLRQDGEDPPTRR